MRELLPILPKPSHYAALEEGCVIKDAQNVKLRVALAFPDTYEVGMSYLGQKILYHIINEQKGWQAERVFLPEREAAEILKKRHIPLASLESDSCLREMDAVCFSVTHELCYADILHMLELAQIPLRAKNRSDNLNDGPLVIAGGGAMLSAEPLAPFIDMAALGDGEEIICEILECLEKAKNAGLSRTAFLEKAAAIPGVYVPSFFTHDKQGNIRKLRENYRPARRIVPNLEETVFPCKQVAPVGAVHNRLSLEISRGCTRGCRFCHAGMVYRPVRERGPAKVAEILAASLRETGFDEVSFLSLSAGDHSALPQLFEDSYARCAKEQISLALPSLRVGSVDAQVLEKMAKLRRTGITLAPEAGSQKLRNVINKGVTEEELLAHIRLLLSYGWRHVKLYFMIGLPEETDEDLAAIVDLCDKVRNISVDGKQKIQVTAALSTFVPKPFTPFQWESQPEIAEIERRIKYILDLSKNRKYLKIRWHDPKVSHLEGILSRADRRMADVVELAYRKGACYCSWTEQFKLEPWLESMKECGLDSVEMTGERKPGCLLPWSHLESGIDERFLIRERNKAHLALTTVDCRNGSCSMCGSCDRGEKKSLLARPAGFTGIYGPVFAKTGRIGHLAQVENRENGSGFVPPPILHCLKEKKCCLRLWHLKKGRYAFLSQLEMQGLFEKAFRKAKVPLSFSGGFHPLPLVSFTRALPVGVASESEWLSLVLHDVVCPEEIIYLMQPLLPEDMKLVSAQNCDMRDRTRQSAREDFIITFQNARLLQEALEQLQKISLQNDYLYVHKHVKGDKTYNLRPFLEKWEQISDRALVVRTNWTQAYLSPKTLIEGLLVNLECGNSFPQSWTICKICQHLDGRTYGSSLSALKDRITA